MDKRIAFLGDFNNLDPAEQAVGWEIYTTQDDKDIFDKFHSRAVTLDYVGKHDISAAKITVTANTTSDNGIKYWETDKLFKLRINELKAAIKFAEEQLPQQKYIIRIENLPINNKQLLKLLHVVQKTISGEKAADLTFYNFGKSSSCDYCIDESIMFTILSINAMSNTKVWFQNTPVTAAAKGLITSKNFANRDPGFVTVKETAASSALQQSSIFKPAAEQPTTNPTPPQTVVIATK